MLYLKRVRSELIHHFFNERGASAVKGIAITIIILLLLGGGASLYFSLKDKSVEFTEEEIASAEVVAQLSFEEVTTIASNHIIANEAEALATLGYEETRRDQQVITYERPSNDLDYYVLLKNQPHESFPNLSRVLVQVFDKEHRVLMTELSNILTWQENE